MHIYIHKWPGLGLGVQFSGGLLGLELWKLSRATRLGLGLEVSASGYGYMGTVCMADWGSACMTDCVHLACCLGKCCVFRWWCHPVYSLESTAVLPMSGLHTYRAVLVSGPMVKCRATPRPSAATPGIPRRHRAEPRRVRGPRSKSVTNPRCRPVAPVRRCWSCRGRQISR